MIKIKLDNFSEIQLLNYIEMTRKQAHEVLQMRNHPDVRRMMFNDQEISDQEHMRFIRSLATCSTKLYFLVVKGKQQIGTINYTHINKLESSTKLGVLANLENPQKGKGSILMGSSIAYFRKFLNLESLYLEVFAQNQKAINLYERFGFVKDGSGRQDNNDVVRMKWMCR